MPGRPDLNFGLDSLSSLRSKVSPLRFPVPEGSGPSHCPREQVEYGLAAISDSSRNQMTPAQFVDVMRASAVCRWGENRPPPDDHGIIALSEPRRFTGMLSKWQTETGHQVCRWSDVGQHLQYNPRWMQEVSDIHSDYLPPPLDFTSHSPFGGATWFQPHPAGRDC